MLVPADYVARKRMVDPFVPYMLIPSQLLLINAPPKNEGACFVYLDKVEKPLEDR
jgi:hypothetical protein